MSSLTDVAREPFSTARHASRRANLAPYFSASFAVLAVAIFILFGYQAGFFDQFATQPPKPGPTNPAEQITVSRSTVTGFDNESLPYAMSAQSAIQDKDVPSKVHLQTVSGQSQRANGDIVKMRANTGLYDTDTKYLDLNGEVEITSPGRFTAHMDAARVSVKEKKLVSDTLVVVDMPNGSTITSKAMQITNNGDDILFFNGVKAKFKSQGSKGDGSP